EIVLAKPQAPDFKPITFEARPDPELIIKSPWSSPCPICNGKHGNYGLHGEWYHENGNQLPYDSELAKLYSQDKLEYCLTCNTSSNKLKLIVA
ncbi:17553_t:CDS:2, partial [Dentiscutata erythropus]